MKRYLDNADLAEKIKIASNKTLNTTWVHKFGAVPAMSQSTTGTIWDINDTVYPWGAWATPGSVTIDRTNVGDANKWVRVQGLDENFLPVEESIQLVAATGNAGSEIFSRVFRAYIHNGSTTNVGNITVRKGGTAVAQISADAGQTLMAIYTVPAGYIGYVMQGTCSAQASADATGNFYVRFPGESAFRVQHSFEVSGTGGQYDYIFTVPPPLPPKTDLDVRATVRTNNGRYTAAFDIVLVKI